MLSICIPTLNRADLLEKNLKHLLTFSKIDIEVCISNNCSSDGTQEVIDKYKDKFKKFQSVTTVNTVDIQQNYSLALKLARQKYTLFLSDDDIANEQDLLQGLTLLEQDSTLSIIYGGFRKYNLDNELLETLKFSEKNEVYTIKDAHKLPGRFISLDLGIHRTNLNKRLTKIHDNYAPISWEALSTMLLYGKVCISPCFFIDRVSHDEQYSNINNNDSYLNDLYFASVETFLSRLDCSINEKIQALVNYKANYYRYRMWRSFKSNHLSGAYTAINRGMLYSPDSFSVYAKEWDQQHLLKASIQNLSQKISENTYLKRVIIHSESPKKSAYLHALLKEEITLPLLTSNDISIEPYHDFIIVFDAADSEGLTLQGAENIETFMDILNALKFTKTEITFKQ